MGLINRMHALHFNARIIRWITNCFSNRFQIVIIDKIYSNPLPVTSGVPQGTVLGSYLFNLYINEIFMLPITNNLTSYADDLKLLGTPGPSLQYDLDLIFGWTIDNNMKINTSKSAVLHFGKQSSCESYNMGANTITPVNSFRDLGVLVDNELTFSCHLDRITLSSFKMINLLFLCFKSENASFFVRCMLLMYFRFLIIVRPSIAREPYAKLKE